MAPIFTGDFWILIFAGFVVSGLPIIALLLVPPIVMDWVQRRRGETQQLRGFEVKTVTGGVPVQAKKEIDHG
jgi:hypothetical protein